MALKANFNFITMLVCLCHPTTEREVDRCMDEGAETVEEVGKMCGAGTGCGACKQDIEDRLRGCARQMVQVRSRQAA